ncbi:MAG: LytTR family DNA-binding domain-containing protein [Gemmatimonadaceae bacterium]
MIKAVIVDDELPARREMRRLLDEHEGIRVVGEAGDLDVGRGLLLRTRPDVVFLDIRLGRRSGFELLPDIDDETAVIFVTAYDHYAVRAFEESAMDYLVKPVDPRRLRSSIDRLRARLAGPAPETDARAPKLYSATRWVFLDSGGTQEFIELADITHIEAEGGNTRVFTRDGRARGSARGLVDWQRRLASGDFVRVHRSALVNLKHVERVEPWFHYSYRIKVRGFPDPVIMSRRHSARLRDVLG